jgi:hypothetical protein
MKAPGNGNSRSWAQHGQHLPRLDAAIFEKVRLQIAAGGDGTAPALDTRPGSRTITDGFNGEVRRGS